MFFLLYYSLTVVPFVHHNIFRGVEDLDQDLEEDIVPGGDVPLGRFPYVAAVFNGLRKFQTCSGFIIHERLVLTAGYCVSRGEKFVDPFYVTVLAGVVDMRDHEMDQWRYAESIVGTNSSYRGLNALVLIKVDQSFFVNYSVKPIRHRQVQHGANTFCTAVTWRFRDKLNRLTLKSLVLKQYSIYVLNQTQCGTVYGQNPVFVGLNDVGYVCMNFVADVEPGTRHYECVGVDGSVIFCEDSDGLYPAGIATELVGGSSCNRDNSPFTFFDVGANHDWIDLEMKRLLQ